jgi:hypothetical protein
MIFRRGIIFDASFLLAPALSLRERGNGRRYALRLKRTLVLTGHGAVSLSFFGGEGQGEEVVVLSYHAR